MFLQALALLALAPTLSSTDSTLNLAVRTGDDAIIEALREAPMQRFVLPQREDLNLAVGADAKGEVVIETCGLPEPPETIRERLAGVPATLHDDGFELGETRYQDPRLAFAVRLPESRHWVICGFDAETTAGVIDQTLRQEAGVRFWRHEEPFDYMVFEHDYSRRQGQWRKTDSGVTIPAQERNDMRSREAAYAGLFSLKRPHLRLRVPAAARQDPRAAAVADQLDDMASKLAKRLGLELDRAIDVVVEMDHVDQGRHTGDIDPAILAGDRLHLVFHADDSDFYRVEMARLLLRRAGIDLSPVLEDGAALWLAEDWYGRHFKEWLPDLAFADVLPNAEEIQAAERPGDGSNVIFSPAIAWGFDQLPGKTLLAKLKGRSSATISGALAALKPPKFAPKAGHSVTAEGVEKIPFQRGVSFAMSNGLEIGYHAPGVDDQLARLGKMGVDAVSLMPFGYQPQPYSSRLAFLNRSPASETDIGVIHAARRAQEKDFFVLWKPHIWINYGSWPGEIEMKSEADWHSWWRSYRRFILHHAILAEFANADMFSVGIELGKTVGRESEWRYLIESVRRIYSGPLTYSGNWWEDYDIVPFWDALDIVGVDAYFPLADSVEASDEELRAGARKIVERLANDSKRYKKPVLLTEIGYAATKKSWVTLHEEGGEVLPENQRRAWAALLSELGRPPWLMGLYAWKVFSHERAEHANRADFRFLERPARLELEKYFLAEPPADTK